MPLYEYDHVQPYSEVGVHESDNIILLCPNHHAMKTKGRISIDTLVRAVSNPFNANREWTAAEEMGPFGTGVNVYIGGNRVRADVRGGVALQIDGHPLISFNVKEGQLGLFVDLCDARRNPLLKVQDNELVHATGHWDYEYTGTRLVIREGPGKVTLDMTYDYSEGFVKFNKGQVSHNGVDVLFNDAGLVVLNNMILLSENQVSGCRIGFSLGNDRRRLGAGFSLDVPREDYDRESAATEALSILSAMRSQ